MVFHFSKEHVQHAQLCCKVITFPCVFLCPCLVSDIVQFLSPSNTILCQRQHRLSGWEHPSLRADQGHWPVPCKSVRSCWLLLVTFGHEHASDLSQKSTTKRFWFLTDLLRVCFSITINYGCIHLCVWALTFW